MQKKDFHFYLPRELIAQTPLPRRSASRLLKLEGATGRTEDMMFDDLPELLHPGDLLVLNDTRVIPARLFGRKETGGRVEVLVERLLDERRILAQVRTSKPLRPAHKLSLNGGQRARVIGRVDQFYELMFKGNRPVAEILEEIGRVPLPPYIAREATWEDRMRYQTVYAKTPGAVAAPTAGLHFDERLFRRLEVLGVDTAVLTLHVGAGTFQPVRETEIHKHRMHAEYVEVTARLCDKVRQTRARGGRVVAVGTTSVRALETASAGGRLAPFRGETDIFIYPGYRFRALDAMITNFHLPESTLLMLACAFAGTEQVLNAYRHAVSARYRFFSYGDAMFVTPKSNKWQVG